MSSVTQSRMLALRSFDWLRIGVVAVRDRVISAYQDIMKMPI